MTTRVKQNYYIPQLNAAKIKRGNGTTSIKDGEYVSISNSLELIYMTEQFPEEFDNNYTQLLISVPFDKDIKKEVEKTFDFWIEDGELVDKTLTFWETDISKNDMRLEFSAEGFFVGEQKYVEYKRTTSESRVGTALYIKEQYLDHMLAWSRLNIADEFVNDIPAFRSYESLVLSSIEAIIDIKPENLLLVSEECSPEFKWNMSVTELIDGALVCTDKEVNVSNSLWDGEALLDSSFFTEDYERHGFMLLRNHFTKMAAFNTNIQQFFTDNGITIVKDMFGIEHKAEDIKLILNPTCIKLFKFKDAFGGMKETWDYLLANLIPYFGICKTDHESKYGNYQSMTYQFLNSLPLTRSDLVELMAEDLKYLDALKNNDLVFKMDLGGSHNTQTPTTTDMLATLLNINSDIQYTHIFKSVRKDRTDNFTKTLRKGHIKVPNSDNATLFGNPYEYLYYAAFGSINESPLKGWEVYCPKYKDGQEVAMFRSPHIASGNVMSATNRYNELLERYFNLTGNIVVINAMDVPVLDCLQGADYDSDFALVCTEEHILRAAKEITESGRYLIPMNKVATNKRAYTFDDKAKIDNKIANNKIGSICNLAQICQSYYWTLFYNNNTDERLDKIYKLISKLSSLSQLEIDKSKKFFSFSMTKKLDEIINEAIELGLPTEKVERRVLNANDAEKYKELIADGSEEAMTEIDVMVKIDKIKKPAFFKYTQPQTKAYFDDSIVCPMSYIQDIIDEQKKAKRTKDVEDSDILTVMDSNKANREQINKIYAAMRETKEVVDHISWKMRCKTINASVAKTETAHAVQTLFVDKVSKLKISEATMCRMIYQIAFATSTRKDKADLKGLGAQTLGWLFATFNETFISSIKTKEGSNVSLLPCKDGEYTFYGVSYKPTETLN